jgi:hypothetical protein
MDFDSPMRERAAALGQTLADSGPQALFDELENLLPNEWREQIRAFPLAAVILGVGAGVYLGMRKGDELLSAGTSMLSAAAMANVSRIMDRGRG